MEIKLNNGQKIITKDIRDGYINSPFVHAFVDNIVNCLMSKDFNITENDITDMTEYAFKIYKEKLLKIITKKSARL